MSEINVNLYQTPQGWSGIAYTGETTLFLDHADNATLRQMYVDRLTSLGYSTVNFKEPERFVIFILGLASGQPSEFADNHYVLNFDREAERGRGLLKTTRDFREALKFKSREGAFTFWKESSLKAYTVEIQSLNALYKASEAAR